MSHDHIGAGVGAGEFDRPVALTNGGETWAFVAVTALIEIVGAPFEVEVNRRLHRADTSSSTVRRSD